LVKSLLFVPYMKFNSGPILSSGWTLNYEMYFYLALSLFLIFTKNVKSILLCTALLLTAIYVLHQFNYSTNNYLAIYGNPIVFEFIFGTMLYWLYKNYAIQYNNKTVLIVLGSISTLGISVMVYFNFTQFEGNRLLLYGVPSFFITCFFVLSENRWRTNTFIYQWLYRLGNASYVIYLIHPFVMNIFIRLVHPLLKIDNIGVALVELVMSIFFLCIISDFVHRKIERPLLNKIEQLLLR